MIQDVAISKLTIEDIQSIFHEKDVGIYGYPDLELAFDLSTSTLKRICRTLDTAGLLCPIYKRRERRFTEKDTQIIKKFRLFIDQYRSYSIAASKMLEAINKIQEEKNGCITE